MREETAVAVKAAQNAGKEIMRRYHTAKGWEKEDRQIVTEADIAAEKILVDVLRKRFPEHGIVSEEAGNVLEGETFWVIDPLDGTHNYFYGIPFFCVVIGLVGRRGIENCVVFDPLRDELFHAERGKGCFRNGGRVSVSDRRSVEEAIVAIPTQHQGRAGLSSGFQDAFLEMRSLGSRGIVMSYIASGVLDATIKTQKGMWHEYASCLLVTEAGGTASDTIGEEAGLKSSLLASNGKVHKKILSLLSRYSHGGDTDSDCSGKGGGKTAAGEV